MLKNAIPLPGVSNSRELGGYDVEGGCIRRGVLIRSGKLHKASPEALRLMSEKYRIRRIVDLRMSNEMSTIPDPVIPGIKLIADPVVEFEDYFSRIGDPGAYGRMNMSELSRMEMFDLAYENGMLGPEIYLVFLLEQRGIKAYRRFFEILLGHDPDNGAILWHCTDGKDRTGLAAMLILSVLGAGTDTIMNDYLLTNEYNAPMLAAVRKEDLPHDIPQEKFEALQFMTGGVSERYMQTAIDTLNNRYGSVTGYVREELGLDDSDLALLRERYICPE